MQEIILKNNLSEHFTLISYPDGQHSIKINLNKLNVKDSVSIKCRIRNFGELEVLFCLVSALKKCDFYLEKIDFVYIFGMRSDRSFELGEPNYFRDIIIPILDLFKCKMHFLSPHNHKQINDYYYLPMENPSNIFLIGGDYSFYKNSNHILDGYFNKKRKEKIEINLEINNKVGFNKNIEDCNEIMILDDLCDGGATFAAEGEYLKYRYPDKKLKLFVYHGLFTQGIHALLSYFDEILCTNSYQDIDHPNVRQIRVI